MTRPAKESRSGLGALWLVLLPILCCAGPALITGGVLAGVGGALGNPWVIAAAAVVAVAAVTAIVRRRATRSGDHCCPPRPGDLPDSADRHESPDPLRKH